MFQNEPYRERQRKQEYNVAKRSEPYVRRFRRGIENIDTDIKEIALGEYPLACYKQYEICKRDRQKKNLYDKRGNRSAAYRRLFLLRFFRLCYRYSALTNSYAII